MIINKKNGYYVIWFNIIWYDMILYDTIWYYIVWYILLCLRIISYLWKSPQMTKDE